MNIKTKLIRKKAASPKVCSKCNSKIAKGEIYHQEEGVDEHLHSMLARQFCTNCYAKYGEPQLIDREGDENKLF
ncbi:MAG: hypothetical protein V5A64_03030 [Candidatus Thermoplasmatota archaeon]